MADAQLSPSSGTAEIEPLHGIELGIAGFVLAMTNFVTVLDTTIANVSIPTIAGGLAVSPSQGTWVVTSYAVAEAITVPLTGWLAQRFGAVRTLCIAMLGFAACSLLCGLAVSLPMLVTCRVMQGICGGPMIPLSQTLLLRVFPKDKAGVALGIWAMTTVVAPILGPIFGGTLAESAGWPWVFYISVPIAVTCAAASWSLLHSRENPIVRERIDYVGLALLIVWVGSLQIMLDKGSDSDWFDSSLIVTLAIIVVVGFAVFLIWELTETKPIVDLRVFRHRSFCISVAVMALAFSLLFSTVVLFPLWLQTDLHYTSRWAGYAASFTGIFAVLISPLIGQVLLPRFDARLLVTFGIGGTALASFWRGQFFTDISFFWIVLPQLVHGLFVAFFFVPITSLALSSVGQRELASAAGLMNFLRTTAASFGTSIMTTLWVDASASHRAALVSHITPSNGETTAALAVYARAGLSHPQAVAALDLLVNQQAVMLATNQIFLGTAALMIVAALVVWLVPKPG